VSTSIFYLYAVVLFWVCLWSSQGYSQPLPSYSENWRFQVSFTLTSTNSKYRDGLNNSNGWIKRLKKIEELKVYSSSYRKEKNRNMIINILTFTV